MVKNLRQVRGLLSLGLFSQEVFLRVAIPVFLLHDYIYLPLVFTARLPSVVEEPVTSVPWSRSLCINFVLCESCL